MSSKLRTLKDLKPDKNKTLFTIDVIQISDLKAEAVKWVKTFRNRKKINSYCEHADQALEINFKDFFNITEEDLK